MEFSGQYLTYEEYQSLGGKLGETPFNLLEFRARKKIDEETFGRLIILEEQKEEVKLCVFELIKKFDEYEKAGGISSESTDGYSINYVVDKAVEKNKAEMLIIKTYLSNCKLEDGTPYLFRGVC